MHPTYIHPPLEFKFVDSEGIPCRAKFWPSKIPCRTYILFIPGNPGIISYYDEFLTALHHESPNTSILGISLAGHEDYEVSLPLSLQEQIDNKVRIVDMIISSTQFSSLTNDKPKLVVAGHSVGAYMAVEILKRRPHSVDNVFLLFPTLSHISQGSSFGRVSAILTSVPRASGIAAWMIFLLRLIFPIPLLALLVRIAYTLPGNSLSTTLAKFFNPATVQSFMHLAKYEFLNIRELDSDTLTKYAKRITVYYAVKDRWVPNFAREQVVRIVSQNGGGAFICDEGFPHAFSLVHGPQMAKKISMWISTLFHPIIKPPTIGNLDSQTAEKPLDSTQSQSISWATLDEEANVSVDTSSDIGRKSHRKESLGGGVIVREQLIRDLE